VGIAIDVEGPQQDEAGDQQRPDPPEPVAAQKWVI